MCLAVVLIVHLTYVVRAENGPALPFDIVKEGEAKELEELAAFDKKTEKRLQVVVDRFNDLQLRVSAYLPHNNKNLGLQSRMSASGAPFFAVGVNTGFDVQSKRIPPVLSSWLNVSEANGLAMKSLILSDTRDRALNVAAVPNPYLCSTSRSQSATEYRLAVDGDSSTEEDKKYFADWGWLKDEMPQQLTPTMVARRTMRCIQYRFLYVIPELLRKFGGGGEYYFLADDDIFTAWPTVLKAMKTLSPDEGAIVGFDGENRRRCGPKHNNDEYLLYGGLFGFTRAAALLYKDTIAAAASEFQFYAINGCYYRHPPNPYVFECKARNNSAVAKAYGRCSKLLRDGVASKQSSASLEASLVEAECHPEKLVRDFGKGEYIYWSGHWKTNVMNDDTVISFWAMKQELKRKSLTYPPTRRLIHIYSPQGRPGSACNSTLS
jgi:hypothetical protein